MTYLTRLAIIAGLETSLSQRPALPACLAMGAGEDRDEAPHRCVMCEGGVGVWGEGWLSECMFMFIYQTTCDVYFNAYMCI